MLRHITIVSFEQAVAAPLATRLLASDGARVIKLERKEGDFARHYDRFANGASSYFTWLNFGKESCVVDLKAEPAFVQSLVAKADVVVQNLAPGSMKRLGLDSQTLRSSRKDLITLDITGYGECSNRKAYDLLVTAEAGLCSITGSEGGEPGRVGVSIADIMTGRVGYAAVLRALLERERTGNGSSISVSLFDVVADMMAIPLLQFRATHAEPPRLGLKHPSIAPYGSFTSKDGVQLIISCQNEREWSSLCDGVSLTVVKIT
jgi:itaconate CoA-transferase